MTVLGCDPGEPFGRGTRQRIMVGRGKIFRAIEKIGCSLFPVFTLKEIEELNG